ncbi:haloacid dehalogenase [Cryphonectria parasitica EP155]|uniref:Haloacid dehalogenase n=1 Tax=Cryphonectria parasitica (strain ATCC 38755 / EP155) TaxID=660469 RepID=A0A9P4XX84_CRYP1|nr:haloacid dehalogenase [Cryphonectria parasitica EP155]KAF3762578.1 haloacid dehalogenase [Cryphonectria parasitica EP155]
MAPKITIAFDLYGTLLSTSSISDDLAHHFGADKADQIATKWRQYQLEYTWRLTSMQEPSTPEVPHIPFDKITRAALVHAVNEAGLHIPDAKADELMRAYDGLVCFTDVLPGLKTLQERTAAGDAEALIFSNGTAAMLSASVAASPTLKLFHPDASAQGAKPLFAKLVSTDGAGRYKPHRDAYEHLQREVGAGGGDYRAQAAVWLVSANPFDVVGARAAGLRAVWVDRQGTGWVDRLGEVISEAGDAKVDLKPTIVVKGVDEAVDKIFKAGI